MIRLLLLFVCALGCCHAADGDLDTVRRLAGNKKKTAEAVTMAQAIVDDVQRDADERFRLRRWLPFLEIKAGQLEQARTRIAAWKAGDDLRLRGLADVAEAIALAAEGRRPDAVALLRTRLADGEQLVRAEAHYRLARLLAYNDKGKSIKDKAVMGEVVGIAEQAAAELADPVDIKSALDMAQMAAERIRDMEAYERVQRRFLAEPVLGVLRVNEVDDHAQRLGRRLVDSARGAEARALYAQQLQRQDSEAARWHMASAWSWKTDGDMDEACAAARRVFTAASDPGYFATEAQRLLIDSLADPAARAAAALTWWQTEQHKDAAAILGRSLGGDDAKRVAEITGWYLHGSTKGSDPGLGIAAASYPERLEIARSVPLSDGQLIRRRMKLLLWAGAPQEAASLGRWWLHMGRSPHEYGAITGLLARCAVALGGDAAAFGTQLRFYADGPVDGLTDLLVTVPDFAPPKPAADDAALLERLRDAAVGIAGDVSIRDRGQAFDALWRIDMLLGRPPRVEELKQLYPANQSGVHELLCAAMIARAGHLGGLADAFAWLDAAGWNELPDWVKKRRGGWLALQQQLRTGKAYQHWW